MFPDIFLKMTFSKKNVENAKRIKTDKMKKIRMKTKEKPMDFFLLSFDKEFICMIV